MPIVTPEGDPAPELRPPAEQVGEPFHWLLEPPLPEWPEGRPTVGLWSCRHPVAECQTRWSIFGVQGWLEPADLAAQGYRYLGPARIEPAFRREMSPTER